MQLHVADGGVYGVFILRVRVCVCFSGGPRVALLYSSSIAHDCLSTQHTNLCIFAQMQSCLCVSATLLGACCSFVCYSAAAAGQNSGRDACGHHRCGCAGAIVIQQTPRPHKL